jgi:hypothetical protein
MNRLRGLSLCVILLASSCSPKEYDSRAASRNDSTSGRDNGAETVKGTDHTRDGQKATKDQLVEKTKETWDLARGLAAQTRDEFVAEAKERLAEMDRKIDEWESQSGSLSEDAKGKWNEEREVLRERRTQMQKELDKVKDASGDAWQEVKAGAKAAWNDLADAFRKSEERFKSKHGESDHRT